jgi:quercetin dioxygenase-like cupin family protein
MFRTHITRAVVVAIAVLMASASVAVATLGSGAVGTTLARGTLDAGVKVHTPDLMLKTRDDIDVVTQSITIASGGHTGWHSHPGPVFVTIGSGTMTFYDADDPACSPTSYTAGDTFIDRGSGHVHIARNEGATDVLLYATYLVPVGAVIRTDAPDPGTCPF